MPENKKHTPIFIIIAALICGCAGTGKPAKYPVKVNPEPNSGKVEFSMAHGFYDREFYVELSSPAEGTVVKYTLDGSSPAEKKGIEYNGPITIEKTTVIRAAAFKRGMEPTEINTCTYIFINDIMHQSMPQDEKNWPEFSVNGQKMDYVMDSDIVKNDEYGPLVKDALKFIPTISLVTDPGNLFGPDNGIYANPFGRGEAWERPVSMELILPGKDQENNGTQINAGLRIRGAYSRISENPKHSFRLYFKSEYGTPNLEYPLFGREGEEEFDKLDLRTSQNYSWAKEGSPQNTMLREIFSRDIMREMDQPYTRSRYIHLYINGYYWGLYQTQERADAFYAKTYMGGNSEDYDVVKVECGPEFGDFEIELTDGTFDKYRDLYEMTQKGFTAYEDYFHALGRNPDNSINTDYPVMIDEINLIDYMLTVFYTGNFDAPITRFRGDMEPNNYYAVYNRNGWEGWQFIMHDSEHSMFDLYDDRTGPFVIRSEFKYFNPGYLHQKLCENPEYRMKFIDRVYEYFFNDGVFTPETALGIMQERIKELGPAFAAESARWGDAQAGRPYTIKDWQKAVDYLTDNYIPQRRDIVLQQLIDDKLYPQTAPPQFHSGDEITYSKEEKIRKDTPVRIVNPNPEGKIYYTLDGSDPRDIGGTVSAGAKCPAQNRNEVRLNLTGTTEIKARIKSGKEWSALQESVFYNKDEKYEGLAVTEISYHPADSGETDGDEFEFIELYNTGSSAINLTGAGFTDGIKYTFPSIILEPGEYTVIVNNYRAFLMRYNEDVPVAGEWEGNLSNSGEKIVLESPSGKKILELTYDDAEPWPAAADGEGYTLVPEGPESNPDDPAYWTVSTEKGGTPGN